MEGGRKGEMERGGKRGRDGTKREGGKNEGKSLRLPLMARCTAVHSTSRISYYFT